MVKYDTNIIIRISEEEKEILYDYCKLNNMKVSKFLRNCALNYIKENVKEGENK